jgi:hypothetical protein
MKTITISEEYISKYDPKSQGRVMGGGMGAGGGITGVITEGMIPVATGGSTLGDSWIGQTTDGGANVIEIDAHLRVTGGITAYSDDPGAPSIWDALPAEVESRIDLSHLRNVNASSPAEDQVLAWNGTAWVPATVTTSGVHTELDPVFTNWRDNRTAYSIPARASGTAGALADIAASSNGVLRRSGTGNLAFGTLVTENIGASQVTFAKMQDISTDRVLGRITASTGAVEQLTGANVRTIADVYSKAEADAKYLPLAGGTITGTLIAAYIGINEASPTERLHVGGNIRATGSLKLPNYQIGGTDYTTHANVFNTSSTTSVFYLDSSKATQGWGFRTHDAGSGYAWSMRIDHNGDVKATRDVIAYAT